jgi:hypothetical protein
LDDLPENVGKGYMVRYPARLGYLYCFRWELPLPVGDGIAWRENTMQRWAVARWLVESGQAPRPDSSTITAQLRVKRRRIDRSRKEPHNPAAASAAERDEAEYQAWQKILSESNLLEPMSIASKKKDLLSRANAMGLKVKPTATKADLLKQIEAAK